MATVKIKFRPSTVADERGTIYYQIIHRRVVRQFKTSFKLYPSEWDSSSSQVIILPESVSRKHYLMEVRNSLRCDMSRFFDIIDGFDRSSATYSADDVIIEFSARKTGNFFPFMRDLISNLKFMGRIRTSETYATTLNSFCRYRKNRDLSFCDIDSDMMIGYESYLQRTGVTPNTSSFYMRILRAVYNRAVDKGLTPDVRPFKHVYTGVEKTVKRAVSVATLRRLKDADFHSNSNLDFARDMFLLSFYLRGMSFVDMAYLRKSDLSHGILTYRRRKTGQRRVIRWEQCMQSILDKYDTSGSAFLLPIIRRNGFDERKQYLYAAHSINHSLKIIGAMLGLRVPLTMYVGRHSWASIARSKNVPLSVISEAMGHDSETTTRIYLASLDTHVIDRANSVVLRAL